LTETKRIDKIQSMTEELRNEMTPRTRQRLVERLGHLVETGRVTEAEAARLRAASGPAEFERVVAGLRERHAGEKLSAAVTGGHMTQEEADASMERLKRGEHPRGLRAHLRRSHPGSSGTG